MLIEPLGTHNCDVEEWKVTSAGRLTLGGGVVENENRGNLSGDMRRDANSEINECLLSSLDY